MFANMFDTFQNSQDKQDSIDEIVQTSPHLLLLHSQHKISLCAFISPIQVGRLVYIFCLSVVPLARPFFLSFIMQ